MTTPPSAPTDLVLVEDSPLQGRHLQEMLARHGFAARLARTGEEALRLVRERLPLLLLSDVTMPGMDGYELCRQVRADPALAALPVILLTALADPEDVLLGLESGADNFVIKPPDEAYLVARVRSMVANRHLRRTVGASVSLEIEVGGRQHVINADRLQILHLLLSTYESAVLRSRQLARAQEEVRRANETLEEKVRERTAALSAEVAERKRLHERFAAVFEASPVGMAVIQADGRLAEVNEQLCRFFGYTRPEMVGRTLTELRAWADPQEREEALAALHHHRRWDREARFRAKAGELRTALVALLPLHLGGSPAFVASFADLTERKALEEELHRFQRTESVGRLASGIAHDMNNILAPIIMGVPLLRAEPLTPPSEKLLDMVEASAQRGAALVRQLLIFSRGIEGTRRPVEPQAVVADVVKMCTQTFPRVISLQSAVAAGTAPIQGDPTQLQQVLLNLAVNARDAMPEGGRLSISAANAEIDESYAAAHKDATPGRYVCLKVADTGTGIAPEIADRIFDPFFTTKAVGKGTGLGLSSVLGIVKSHGGFVRVDSEPGRGTTFEVYLPASTQPVAAAAAEAAAAAPDRRGEGELILVVDDEENIRNVVRDTLVRAGYRVVSAVDGVEAAATFAANPQVQLVITDVDMPLMDGFNLARVLRRMSPGIRIILSTGLGGRSGTHRREADLRALAITHVLMKPYTRDTLLRVIGEALRPGE